jgi:heat-inducible transcriptional repressor
VAIGTETGMQPLSECSLVVSPYEVGGRTAGTIGVLGPTRMDYPQALAAVAVVSQKLGYHLTEG